MIELVKTFLAKNHSAFLLNKEPVESNIPNISINPEGIVPVIKALKEDKDLAFGFLNDLTAIDWMDKKDPRFEVVYLLKSFKSGNHTLIQIRVPVEEGEAIPSLTGVFKGANWPEREVYDLFGISFIGHPFMERIVLPDNFVGHPLRKDYPLEGPGQDYLIENLLQIHIDEDIAKES
ncbi:MAG: NADH-quinone oxidoreductase subunit C [Leptospira sp.]|jgi:NADH-quinone oxidoreductase subunit C|nr:NADH-quinone oxidoreductase subunit C [Leptospira sp.]